MFSAVRNTSERLSHSVYDESAVSVPDISLYDTWDTIVSEGILDIP